MLIPKTLTPFSSKNDRPNLTAGLRRFASHVRQASGCHYLRVDMTRIQYQGETLPPSPLVLVFHLVLGKFHIYLRGGCFSILFLPLLATSDLANLGTYSTEIRNIVFSQWRYLIGNLFK